MADEVEVVDTRGAVEAAFNQAEESIPDTPASAPEPVSPESAPAPEPPTPPSSSPAPVEAKEVKPAVKAKSEPVSEPEHIPSSRIDRAPATWKGEAKAVWASLPLHVRQEVIRRERDMETSFREHAQNKTTLDAINNTVAPYADIINKNYGGSPAKAVQQLLEVEKILSTSSSAQKAQFVANLIKHYDVDVQALDGFLVNQVSPEYKQQMTFQQMLDQRLAPLMDYVQQQQQAQQQNQQSLDQQMEMTVAQMAADTEKYPYFFDVRNDMADLIDMSAKKGAPISLEEAYSKAVRMNDLTFDATTAQRVQSMAAQAQQQANAAKAASSSISGSPIPQPVTPPDPTDLHALLSSVYDNAGGRV